VITIKIEDVGSICKNCRHPNLYDPTIQIYYNEFPCKSLILRKYVNIPEHFQHQLSCGAGSLVSSLWIHRPVEEVHFRPYQGHQYVQGKPEEGEKMPYVKIIMFANYEAPDENIFYK
jgi:hypothetical protein